MRRGRSTKAGPSGPATLPDRNEGRGPLDAQRRPALPGRQPLNRWLQARHTDNLAQRRPALPGRQPRVPRHGRIGSVPRSTKAGPSGPATPGRRCSMSLSARPLNEGRPFRAGNPRSPVGSVLGLSALNEGRPFRAGNPLHLARGRAVPLSAQRRPALPGRQPCVSGVDSPGDGYNAQRRPALPGRQPPITAAGRPGGSTALNEGRPFRAGNPPHLSGCR